MGESHLRILGHWLAPHPLQVYTLLSFYPVRCIAPFRITHACSLATDPLVLMHLRPCACFLCHCGASPRSPPFPFIGIAGSQFVQVHRIALGLECTRLASVSHAPHSILHRFPIAGGGDVGEGVLIQEMLNTCGEQENSSSHKIE